MSTVCKSVSPDWEMCLRVEKIAISEVAQITTVALGISWTFANSEVSAHYYHRCLDVMLDTNYSVNSTWIKIKNTQATHNNAYI